LNQVSALSRWQIDDTKKMEQIITSSLGMVKMQDELKDTLVTINKIKATLETMTEKWTPSN